MLVGFAELHLESPEYYAHLLERVLDAELLEDQIFYLPGSPVIPLL